MKTKAWIVRAAACAAFFSAGAAAQSMDGDRPESPETIYVWGERLEESLPLDLAEYGSRVEIITAKQIRDGGYADISQALSNLVPGLYVAPKNGAFDYVNVSLQGSRQTEVLWLVDGVRISNRLYNSTTPLDTLPANMVERIEVLKGGQALFYGTQAVAGVINVVTKSFTSETEGSVTGGFNTNGGRHFNAYARGGLGPHRFVVYGSADEADGFQPFRDEDYQPSATDRRRGYDVMTFGAKYGVALGADLRFTASWQHTDAELDFATAEDSAVRFNARNEDIVSAKIDWSPTDRLDVFVKGYWHDWDSTFTRIDNVLGVDGLPTGALNTISDAAIWRFTDKGVNVLSQYAATSNLDILIGYDFQTYDGRDDEFLIGQQSESVHAPFGQARLNLDLLKGARLAAGVRHNMPSDGQSKTVWNVSGEIDIIDGLFARGQVGTSFRLPSAYELYVIDPCCETGNPNLVGEESFNLEAAIGGRTDRFSWEVIGFSRRVEDLIGIDFSLPAFPDGFLVNTDEEVKTWGVEVFASAVLHEGLTATVDYTHTEAELENSGEQIRDVPVDLVKFQLDWSPDALPVGAGLALNYVGDVYDRVSGGVGRVEHGNYAVLDFSGRVYLDRSRRHVIRLRLENVFDNEYATQVRRVRRDSDGTSYGADALGTPRTLYGYYTFTF